MTTQLAITTGASSNHFLPLQSLLWTIAKFEPTARVIVYDLGLTRDEHAALRDTPPFYLANWELRTFDFAKYPPHFSIEQEAGRMAFRPIILAEVARNLTLVGRASSRAVPVTTENAEFPLASRSPLAPPPSHLLLWLDSGCQLREPLHEIRACIARDGVYCPCAPGTIGTCLHPAARAPLGVTEELLPLPIRDAGICGFHLSTYDVAAVYDRRTNLSSDRRQIPAADRRTKILTLLNRWSEVALDKNSTAPENSTRRTHRQDAVFAVLLNQAARANDWKLESKRVRGLAIKQDTLTLAETKFRTLGAPPSRRQVPIST